MAVTQIIKYKLLGPDQVIIALFGDGTLRAIVHRDKCKTFIKTEIKQHPCHLAGYIELRLLSLYPEHCHAVDITSKLTPELIECFTRHLGLCYNTTLNTLVVDRKRCGLPIDAPRPNPVELKRLNTGILRVLSETSLTLEESEKFEHTMTSYPILTYFNKYGCKLEEVNRNFTDDSVEETFVNIEIPKELIDLC